MKTAQMKPPTSSVQGDPAYSNGAKIYVISKEKMQRERLTAPADEKEIEDFFKLHADSVIINEQNVPVVKVDVASGAYAKVR